MVASLKTAVPSVSAQVMVIAHEVLGKSPQMEVLLAGPQIVTCPCKVKVGFILSSHAIICHLKEIKDNTWEYFSVLEKDKLTLPKSKWGSYWPPTP